jgi:multidrug efflux system membrane fusion protein
MLSPLFFAGCGEKPKPAGKGTGGGAAPVLVGKVQRKVAPLTINAIGAVEPIRTTGVRAQVTGTLQKIDFKEGQEVKEGDLLFEIDPRPFENALRSAQADLQKAKVQLDNEVAEVERYKGLSEQGMVSKEQYLSIQTAERTARAALASAEAAVANDQLSLDYCSVRAPFSGLTGSLGVHEGDLVRASDANIAMITINQISPVYVTFSVPQDNLAAIVRYRAAGSLEVKATPPGQNQKPETGTLSFIDNNIDSTTGTLKLKASFPNADHRLWPGQFADVRLTLDSPEAIVVPTVAVQNDQTGQHVFVVKDDMTAEFRNIIVDRAVDSDSVVSKGLSPGETVVTEGQLRVLPGKPVQIKPAGTKDAGESPATPGDAAPKKGKAKGAQT